MAVYGDSLLRPQVPETQGGRRSEVSLLDHPLVRSKSGHSSVASTAHYDEYKSASRRSAYTGEDTYSLAAADKVDFARRSSTPVLPPAPQKSARTIPAWVQSAEDNDNFASTSPLLSQPGNARVAEHHFAPHKRQREFLDSLDDTETYEREDRESRWKTFAKSTAYPRPQGVEEKQVSHDWLDDNLGDYSQPWEGGNLKETDLESGIHSMAFSRNRKRWFERFQYKMLRSPMVPLIIRLTVFVFSTIALALGGSIRYYSTKFQHKEGPSAEMAIVVDAVALVYLVYITWDEYTGKPLGLRPPKAKMRLIFLDLIFIVFDSANLSLAFTSLSDATGSCTDAEVNSVFFATNNLICERQKALASVLLVALVAWLMTFAISVLRVVERVAAK